MYVGNDFPDVTPNDERPLTLDFTNDLDTVELITSVIVHLEVPADKNTLTDPNPDSHLQGTPVIASPFVTQKVGGLLPGIIYRFRIVATTNEGNEPELYTHIRCVDLD